MQDASFITSDLGHAKKDRPAEMKLKLGGEKMEPGLRRVPNPILGISFMVLWTKSTSDSTN